MIKYLDAHCHLLDGDIPADIGVITNATNPTEWGRVIALVKTHTNVFGAIGIHPWYIGNLPPDWDTYMYDLLSQNPDIMVGEIGLDKHKPDMDTQISVFERQLEIAHELQRGIHVHCVGAWNHILQIFKSHRSKIPPFVLFHRYNGNPKDIERLAHDYNAYFSYHQICPELMDATPSTRMFLETDSTAPEQIVAFTNTVATLYPDCNFYNNMQRMLTNG